MTPSLVKLKLQTPTMAPLTICTPNHCARGGHVPPPKIRCWHQHRLWGGKNGPIYVVQRKELVEAPFFSFTRHLARVRVRFFELHVKSSNLLDLHAEHLQEPWYQKRSRATNHFYSSGSLSSSHGEEQEVCCAATHHWEVPWSLQASPRFVQSISSSSRLCAPYSLISMQDFCYISPNRNKYI